jgi:hypothetical protein
MTAVALEATRIRVRGATVLAGAVLIVATLVAWWAGMPYVVGVWHDDGVYALLGRAISSGQGFHYTQLPGAPAATHYPPAYPLVLAAVWRLSPSFPDNIAAFLAVNAMFVGLAAFGAFRFTRTQLAWRDEWAGAFALASTLTTPVLTLSGAVLSEPMFLAGLWPTLIVAERAARPDGTRRDAIVAGLCAGALMLVRTHAVALALSLVVVLAVRRRPLRALWVAAAAALLVLPWQIWTMSATPRVPAPLAGAYGSYLGWFVAGVHEGGLAFVAATVRINARELWLLVQDRVLVADLLFPRVLAVASLLALTAAGAWRAARQAPVTLWFLAAYLAVVVVWPYAPWRFLWAVWPVVLLLAALGAWWSWSVTRSVAVRGAVACAAALVTLGMVRTEAHAYATRAWSTPALQAGAQITPLVAWVGQHTRQSDIVLAEGEQVISLFTGRRAAPTAPFSAREYVVPRTVDGSAAELREMLALVPARYVLPLAPVQLEAARALGETRPALRAIAPLPSSVVFEVLR